MGRCCCGGEVCVLGVGLGGAAWDFANVVGPWFGGVRAVGVGGLRRSGVCIFIPRLRLGT